MDSQAQQPLPTYFREVETVPLKGPSAQRPMESRAGRAPSPLSTVVTAPDDKDQENEQLLTAPTAGSHGNEEEPCSTCCSWLDPLLKRCCEGGDDE